IKEIDDRRLRRARWRVGEEVTPTSGRRRARPQSQCVSRRHPSLAERSTIRSREVGNLLIDNGSLLSPARRSGLAELEKRRQRAAADEARKERNARGREIFETRKS